MELSLQLHLTLALSGYELHIVCMSGRWTKSFTYTTRLWAALAAAMIGIPAAQRRVVKVRYFTHTTRLWAAMVLAAARPDSPPPGRHSEDIHLHHPALGCNPYGAAQLVSPDSPAPGRKSEKIPGREEFFHHLLFTRPTRLSPPHDHRSACPVARLSSATMAPVCLYPHRS